MKMKAKKCVLANCVLNHLGACSVRCCLQHKKHFNRLTCSSGLFLNPLFFSSGQFCDLVREEVINMQVFTDSTITEGAGLE